MDGTIAPPVASAYTAPPRTASLYESTVNYTAGYNQGVAQGSNGRSGLVILDFGRPAQSGSTYGFYTFGHNFASMSGALSHAEGYADGWWNSTGSSPTIIVAIGTNNSYTKDSGNCPCVDQVSDLGAWGKALGGTENSLYGYLSLHGEIQQETAAGADDAEPAYDPQWTDTHDVLWGYNVTTSDAMYDYGSAESGYWETEPGPKLLEAVWGFPDAFLVGQVYYTSMATQWENLILYDRTQTLYNQNMYMSGVMSTGGVPLTTQQAYDAMMTALNSHSSTAQSSIQFSTYIESG